MKGWQLVTAVPSLKTFIMKRDERDKDEVTNVKTIPLLILILIIMTLMMIAVLEGLVWIFE